MQKLILILSDLHAPYQHPDALDFIKALIKETGFSHRKKGHIAVCLGDEIDGHSWSFHDSDPSLLAPADELKEATWFHQDLSKVIPKMSLIDSNHGSLIYRKQKTHGLPMEVFKSYGEILQVPKTWKWTFDLTLKMSNGQSVYFHHGKNANVTKLSQSMGMSAVQGHYHEKFKIEYWGNPLGLNWGMQCGCLIDPKSYAFAYNKTNLQRPIIGTGIIQDGIPKLVPMILGKNGRWVRRLYL
jgi:predicted phosphodiesterase